VLIVAWFISFAPPVMVGPLRIDHAVEDAVLMLIFGWLALTRDRWWLFVMTASLALTVMVHFSMAWVPGLDHRADVAARLGLGVLTMASLLLGVAERWMAGEPPAIAGAQWRRRIRAS